MLRRLLERLRGWLASPRVTIGVVALAVLLSLPSITTGLAADDYWHKLALTGGHAEVALVQNHWWKLFTFFDGDPERMRSFIDRGIAPWWSDQSTRVSFFQPDGVPNKVAFTFADALDGPTLDFRAWRGQAIVPFTLPAVGERITIDGQVIAPF